MKTNNIHKNHKKVTGFKVPENYFENFNDTLLKSLSEVENTSILSQKITTGLKTPDGYFNTLENILLQKIQLEEEQKRTKEISLFTSKNIISLVGIAAMIAIIIAITLPKENTTIDFNSIAITEIEEYLNEQNIELSETDLATLLENEANISNMFTTNTNDISDDILIEYLSDSELEDEMYYE